MSLFSDWNDDDSIPTRTTTKSSSSRGGRDRGAARDRDRGAAGGGGASRDARGGSRSRGNDDRGRGGTSSGGGGGASQRQDDEFYSQLMQEQQSNNQELKDPLFVLEKVNFLPVGLRQMVVSSNIIAMAQENGHVIRSSLSESQDIQDIEVGRKDGDQIHRIFLDPTGNHLVVSMRQGDNYYLQSTWNKPKVLAKAKGVKIESIAWDSENTDSYNTKEILVGSDKGAIFCAVFDATDKNIVRQWKPVFNLNVEHPITGLHLEHFPPTSGDPVKYYIVATTPTRIYEFIGGPTFDSLFEQYDVNSGFNELPGAVAGYSEFQVFRRNNQGGLPNYFAWMTDPGIFHGGLHFANQEQGDTLQVNPTLLAYPADSTDTMMGGVASTLGLPPMLSGSRTGGRAVSIAITEFHFLVVYRDKFQAICRLNDKVVFEQTLPQKFGRVQGLAADPTNGRIWVYTEGALFEIGIIDEGRDVWRLYLEAQEYDLAIKFAKTPEQRDVIYTSQADTHFASGNFKEAAAFYGKTSKQFEEVALRFINRNERDALMMYLLQKLDSMSPQQSTQRTMLCTWLVEIYLNKLNNLSDENDNPQPTKEAKAAMKGVEEELTNFLEQRRQYLDYKTTINLITSHGRNKEMIYYATLMEDYERVISHHINTGDFKKALVVMAKQTNEELFYRFSPTLMHEAPYYTVNTWMRATFLQPRKLVPALMRYDKRRNPRGEKENQSIRYLEFCVNKQGNTDQAIHNFLLSLYAQEQDEQKLMDFLTTPDPYFDLKYALRLCTQYKVNRAMVLIYGAMELYEEAVELALDVDIELAKEYADRADDDEELRKKLWLRVARHVVTSDGDISRAMAFLQECELLKIEDILPFFPDFTTIDVFREEICYSLENYNNEIEDLRHQMDDATQSAEEIRSDIKKLRNKYGFVEGQQTCDLCEAPVLTRQFYLFPCQHVFHTDCLLREVSQRFTDVERQKVNALKAKISSLEQEAARNKSSGGITGNQKVVAGRQTKLESAKTQLDELVAFECRFCGYHMIETVADPFITMDDEQEAQTWLLED